MHNAKRAGTHIGSQPDGAIVASVLWTYYSFEWRLVLSEWLMVKRVDSSAAEDMPSIPDGMSNKTSSEKPGFERHRGALALVGAWKEVGDERIEALIAEIYEGRETDGGP